MIYKLFFAYLVIINIVGVIVCIRDKYAARKGYWRVKESTLINLCIFGASFGIFLCMKLIKHKTKHNKFMIGIPVIMVLQLLLVVIVLLHI